MRENNFHISKRLFKSLLVVLPYLLLMASNHAAASPLFVPPSDSTVTDSSSANKTNFMLLPIVFSSPDTRLAIGVLPQVVFRTAGARNPSSIRMDAYYTQNKQYHFLLRPTFWLRDDNWSLSGKFSLKEWPTTFYGIGNTMAETEEKFTETLYEFSMHAITKIEFGTGYYAGLSYGFRHGTVQPHQNDGVLHDGSVAGSGRSLTSSIGGLLRQDTRDNHFYPTKGNYHTVQLSGASKLLGSDFTYLRLSLDLRKYFPLPKSQVVAVQGVASFTSGTVPFRELASVGSTLRGYSTMRHIDQNVAAFQLEYRVAPLFWRVGFVAFAGVGDVFRTPADLQFNRLKYSAGIGLRLLFSRSENINIRVDYGLGRDSSADYIDINEAF